MTMSSPMSFVHDVVVERASNCPGRVALRSSDGVLSYGALDRWSARVAAWLRCHGVGPESRVGLLATPSVWAIVAEVGVLRAGGAFVPIDPLSPPGRLRRVERDGVELILVGPGERMAGAGVPVVDISRLPSATSRVESASLAPDNAAYVIYTSGSTGEPKGVINTHGALAASTAARGTVYPERLRSFLLVSPLFFDSSLAGLYWSLTTGAEVVLTSRSPATEPETVLRTARRARPSHVLALPSLYGALLDLAGPDDLTSLQRVIVAGEPCHEALPKRHRDVLPDAEFAVEWGVTEASVWSSVDDAPAPLASPLGRPIPGATVVVRDERLRPADDGVAGELFIGGPGLARGYTADPRSTALRFRPDPDAGAGARCYRTGDRGVRHPDGRLQFLGRVDNQIKLQGVRIEPEEIETAIRSHANVHACVVVPVRDLDGNPQSLVAFVVAADGRSVRPSQVRGHLLGRVARYLIPARVEVVPTLPTLPTGKHDRAALAARAKDVGPTYEGPRDPLVAFLSEIWQDVLGVAGIGPDDDFLAIGGHSLTALRIAARIRAELHVPIRVDAVFRAPTISQLAALLDGDTDDEG